MFNKFFQRKEFACKCGCGFDTADYELVMLLFEMRVFFGELIILNDGCRCPRHNTAVGGVAHSQHLLGKAADIRINTFTPKEVYANLCDRYRGKFGFKEYKDFVHVDVRGPVWREPLNIR